MEIGTRSKSSKLLFQNYDGYLGINAIVVNQKAFIYHIID